MNYSSIRKQPWSLYMATLSVLVVGLLKWKNGHILEDLLIYMVLAFGMMYILIEVCIYLFDKLGIWSSLQDISENRDGKANLRLVHTSEKTVDKNKGKEHNLSGQVEPSLASGLQNEQARTEIKQRMGLS